MPISFFVLYIVSVITLRRKKRGGKSRRTGPTVRRGASRLTYLSASVQKGKFQGRASPIAASLCCVFIVFLARYGHAASTSAACPATMRRRFVQLPRRMHHSLLAGVLPIPQLHAANEAASGCQVNSLDRRIPYALFFLFSKIGCEILKPFDRRPKIVTEISLSASSWIIGRLPANLEASATIPNYLSAEPKCFSHPQIRSAALFLEQTTD